jgi:hypothetical protein
MDQIRLANSGCQISSLFGGIKAYPIGVLRQDAFVIKLVVFATSG